MRTLHCLSLLMLLVAAGAVAQTTDADLAAYMARSEAAAPAPLLDRASFAEHADLRGAQLSPDGKYVAWIMRRAADNLLYVLDTATRQSSLLLTSPTLASTEWTRDSSNLLLNLGATIGKQSVNRSTPPTYLAALKRADGDYYAGPDHTSAGGILVIRKVANAGHLLQRIDLAGNTTDIFRTTERIESAFLSEDGMQAFVELESVQQRRIVSVVNAVETTLLTCTVIEDCRPLAYEAATQQLWLLTNAGGDKVQLETLSLADQHRQTRHSDPMAFVDVGSVTLVADKPLIVQYHSSTAHNYGIDDSTDPVLAALAARFVDSNITTSVSNDRSIWLLREESAVLAEPHYYIYTTATQAFNEILVDEHTTRLPAASALAATLPLQYRASSDDMLLHGYVTVPSGMPLNRTPLIALPHGGPWGRVTSNYAALTQFLVNRGYSVFEPNFRSSTGYGLNYMRAANRQFGNSAVQQDITDGVQYLLAHGIGNADQLAIVGSSFGGFSVLAGLVFTPDLFKLGIAGVPPAAMGSSLLELLRQPRIADTDPALKETMRLLMADPDDAVDMQRLYDMSPQAQLAAIKAPLFIFAGADDDRVSISHVKDYSLQLFNEGKTLSLLIDEDEGHGFNSEHARLASFHMMEKMLALYLGGRSQPMDDPLLAGYIKRKLLLNSNPALTID